MRCTLTFVRLGGSGTVFRLRHVQWRNIGGTSHVQCTERYFDTMMFTKIVQMKVRIPDTARADGWMSHDATEAVVMKKGTYVKLSTASIPLPTVSTERCFVARHRVCSRDVCCPSIRPVAPTRLCCDCCRHNCYCTPDHSMAGRPASLLLWLGGAFSLLRARRALWSYWCRFAG